jgi:hypothetical protein
MNSIRSQHFQEQIMATFRLGDIAPDFIQDSSEGPISFHDRAGDL